MVADARLPERGLRLHAWRPKRSMGPERPLVVLRGADPGGALLHGPARGLPSDDR